MASVSVDPNQPAISPPPGVQSNFTNPPSQVKGIIILEAIFIPLMLLAVAARVWVRTRIVKIWGADDSGLLDRMNGDMRADSLQLLAFLPRYAPKNCT